MKNKTLILVLIVLIMSTVKCFCQEKSDTIYYNLDWKETIKDSASYYRTITKENLLYRINDYYLSGTLQMSGHSKTNGTDEKEGLFSYYSKKGVLSMQGEFRSNKKEGEWKDFDSIGKLVLLEHYTNGKYNGAITGYYQTGEIQRKASYKDGKVVFDTYYTIKGKKIKNIDVDACYKGGPKKMNEFISKNLVYPEEAINLNLQGKVFLSFIIDKEGNVTRVTVEKGVHPILDKQAVELIESMPQWTPAILYGKPTKSLVKQVINFALTN